MASAPRSGRAGAAASGRAGRPAARLPALLVLISGLLLALPGPARGQIGAAALPPTGAGAASAAPQGTEPPPETEAPPPPAPGTEQPPAAEQPPESQPPEAEPPATQPPETPPTVAAPAPQPNEPAPPNEPGSGAGSAAAVPGTPGGTDLSNRPTRDSFLPRLDVYFPEGDLDLRVNRLVNKTFFEGQVKYNFVSGDITAFLRYRYYSFSRITQFTVFDAISFPSVEHFSNDFDRVRGALMLFQWPRDYNHRMFLLTEVDRISSNTIDLQFNNNTTNNFIRLGYQIGTPDDPHSNAIVAESRAERQTLFTAVREIGPNGFGLTGALTGGIPYLGGDYRYIRVELEALKRLDLTQSTFLVGRFHVGTFPYKVRIRPNTAEINPLDQYSIPHSEYFDLGGRDNLKGLKRSLSGSDEVHSTLEYFFPWFLDANREFLHLEWQNFYWILYSGIGTVGFDHKVFTGSAGFYPDLGVGFESSVRLRHRYRFFLSGIVAQTLKGSSGLEARLSVKSYR